MAELCQRNRQVARDSGFALGWLRACDQQRVGRPVRGREQNRSTQTSERLDERGMLRSPPINAVPRRARIFLSSISSRRESFILWKKPMNSTPVAIWRRHNGNQGQRRKTKEPPDVIIAFDGVIHALLEERRADTEPQSEKHSHSQIQECFRLSGFRRRFSGVHNADVASLQARGDSGFFQLLQQAFVKLFVCVYFTFQNAVLN